MQVITTAVAAHGNADAEFKLGMMHCKGQGVIMDYVKAAELFKIAAAKGHASAQCRLGNIYYDGDWLQREWEPPFEKDVGKAVELWELAAAQGHTGAQACLGMMYFEGNGVPKDNEKAVELWQLATAQGHAVAQSSLGAMYYNGNGVSKDVEKAFELYELASAQDHAGAQLSLGMMYYKGNGVLKDVRKAIEMFKRAAAQGNEEAHRCLDKLYSNAHRNKQAQQCLVNTQVVNTQEERHAIQKNLIELMEKQKDEERLAAEMTAQLLREEEQQEEEEKEAAAVRHTSKKKRRNKLKKQEKKTTATVVDIVPHQPTPQLETIQVDTKEQIANAALRSAIDTDELEAIVDAITKYSEFGTLLPEARAARDKIKHRRKKALKQERAHAEELARAESAAPELIHQLLHQEDFERLQAAVIQTEAYFPILPRLDINLKVGRERLIKIRATAKAAAIEEDRIAQQEDESAMPSESEEVRMLNATSTESMLVTLDPKMTADHAAGDSAPSDMDKPPPPGAEALESAECVVCLDAPSTHLLAPCGHQCVCERCVGVGGRCPICRAAVAMKVKVFRA